MARAPSLMAADACRGTEAQGRRGICGSLHLQSISHGSTTSPLSSRLPRRAVGPKRRDLRFYGPFVEMFSTEFHRQPIPAGSAVLSSLSSRLPMRAVRPQRSVGEGSAVRSTCNQSHMEAPPPTLSSRPKRRDLRFYGPVVEMFSTEFYRQPVPAGSAALSPLSSRLPRRAVGPKRRDLRFYGPFVEMFSTEFHRNESQLEAPPSRLSWKNLWSGRRGSNPQPTAWEAATLPLSYSRPLPPDYSNPKPV